jgi:hypothetical protein
MSYILYVAAFGATITAFLWLRDARIYYRTGFAGYRKAAYYGVLCSALATAGVACALASFELIGLGLVLAALYLQGRITRENVWRGSEPALDRMIGSAPLPKANKK